MNILLIKNTPDLQLLQTEFERLLSCFVLNEHRSFKDLTAMYSLIYQICSGWRVPCSDIPTDYIAWLKCRYLGTLKLIKLLTSREKVQTEFNTINNIFAYPIRYDALMKFPFDTIMEKSVNRRKLYDNYSPLFFTVLCEDIVRYIGSISIDINYNLIAI